MLFVCGGWGTVHVCHVMPGFGAEVEVRCLEPDAGNYSEDKATQRVCEAGHAGPGGLLELLAGLTHFSAASGVSGSGSLGSGGPPQDVPNASLQTKNLPTSLSLSLSQVVSTLMFDGTTTY